MHKEIWISLATSCINYYEKLIVLIPFRKHGVKDFKALHDFTDIECVILSFLIATYYCDMEKITEWYSNTHKDQQNHIGFSLLTQCIFSFLLDDAILYTLERFKKNNWLKESFTDEWRFCINEKQLISDKIITNF